MRTLLGWIFVEPFWAGSGRLEEELGAGLDDRIMLSKATSSVRDQRSHSGRYVDTMIPVAIPAGSRHIYAQ